MNIGFVSLGCSKNLIDTEVAIGKLKNKYKIVNDPKKAEIIIVNTCGFIDSAKEEAINTILEMAEYKNRRCKYLIAMGCLVQRYFDTLPELLPEVDLFLRISDYPELLQKIDNLVESGQEENYANNGNLGQERNGSNENSQDQKYNGENEESKELNNKKVIEKLPMFGEEEYLARTVSTGENYAYLKIGEGCSNMCTYCAIPYIRGLFVSRPMEDIIKEAEELAKRGIKELIIIAQDTTKYGEDLYGVAKLPELLDRICKIEGIKWVRFLYAYPEGITDELINVVKQNEKIAKYFDIPIQHISNKILNKMNRKTSKEHIESLIQKIRKEIPEVILRTSLIVGFPGETKEDFDELYNFVKTVKFDKLGVFEYSKEEGTPASLMPDQVHHMTKKSRYNKIMSIQQEVSREDLEKNIGKQMDVLIENMSFDKKYLVGRTKNDVPEIDGIVYIKKTKENEDAINQFIKVRIVDVDNYDLIGESI